VTEGREEACQDAHDGGLARAVGAEQPDDLATLDVERDVIHRDGRTELLAQVLDVDHAPIVILFRVEGQTRFTPEDVGYAAGNSLATSLAAVFEFDDEKRFM